MTRHSYFFFMKNVSDHPMDFGVHDVSARRCNRATKISPNICLVPSPLNNTSMLDTLNKCSFEASMMLHGNMFIYQQRTKHPLTPVAS